jgi:hypothetical protein
MFYLGFLICNAVVLSGCVMGDTSKDTGATENTNPDDTNPDDTNPDDTNPDDTNPDDTGSTNETGTDSDTEVDPEPVLDLEIIGNYFDGSGTEHAISANYWVMDYGSEEYSYALTQYSNEDRWLVGENALTNDGDEAGKWSHFDWTFDADGALWFCQTTWLADSEEDAINWSEADPTMPSRAGCGPYSWFKLTPF